jgi:hypothetical protein
MKTVCPLCHHTVNSALEQLTECSSCKQIVLVTEDRSKYIDDAGRLTPDAHSCIEAALGKEIPFDDLDYCTNPEISAFTFTFWNKRQLVSAKTAAQLLGVQPDWVKFLSLTGMLPGVKTGKKPNLPVGCLLSDLIGYPDNDNFEDSKEFHEMQSSDCKEAIRAAITAAVYHAKASVGTALYGMQLPSLILDELIINHYLKTMDSETLPYRIPNVTCPARVHFLSEGEFLQTLYGNFSPQQIALAAESLFESEEADYLDIWMLNDTKIVNFFSITYDQWDLMKESPDTLHEGMSTPEIFPQDLGFPERVAHFLKESENQPLFDAFQKAETRNINAILGAMIQMFGPHNLRADVIWNTCTSAGLIIPVSLIPNGVVFLFSEASNMGFVESTHSRYGCLVNVTESPVNPELSCDPLSQIWSINLFIETVSGEILLHPSKMLLHFSNDDLIDEKLEVAGPVGKAYHGDDFDLAATAYHLLLSTVNTLPFVEKFIREP